jgi:hypothetical protein
MHSARRRAFTRSSPARRCCGSSVRSATRRPATSGPTTGPACCPERTVLWRASDWNPTPGRWWSGCWQPQRGALTIGDPATCGLATPGAPSSGPRAAHSHGIGCIRTPCSCSLSKEGVKRDALAGVFEMWPMKAPGPGPERERPCGFAERWCWPRAFPGICFVALALGSAVLLATGTAGALPAAHRVAVVAISFLSAAGPGLQSADGTGVSMLVDRTPCGHCPLRAFLSFNISALLAEIQAGRLVARHCGRCEITGALAIQVSTQSPGKHTSTCPASSRFGKGSGCSRPMTTQPTTD